MVASASARLSIETEFPCGENNMPLCWIYVPQTEKTNASCTQTKLRFRSVNRERSPLLCKLKELGLQEGANVGRYGLDQRGILEIFESQVCQIGQVTSWYCLKGR
jgi:hypothetical protein